MDLLAFERKLDQTIMRKRVDIQEALKRPMKVTTGADLLTVKIPLLLIISVIFHALVSAAKAKTEALHFQHLQPRQAGRR